LKTAFKRISRVGSLLGGTRWYLSDDCLLAAKRVMYAVEYRRFYLRDIESIVVWPNRMWLLRPIIPGAILAVLAGILGYWVSWIAGAIPAGVGLVWVLLEVALGPTAESRIRTLGATVDMPIVGRTRRARKVLAKIDAAVLAARGGAIEQASAPAIAPAAAPNPAAPQSAAPLAETNSEAASPVTPVGDLT
jgi:hypothetical protein